MNENLNTVQIDYYSDVLCVWAYLGHARTRELQAQFPEQLAWRWHYLPVFGDVPGKLENQWRDRGGAAAYAAHVQEVVTEFGHVKLNKDCWTGVCPVSSAPAHLWLAAARLAEQAGDIPVKSEEALAWALRVAFFEQAADISRQPILVAVASDLGMDVDALTARVNDGTAYAVFCEGMQKARDANVRVSPTYVFNEERQRLTGNVGYRIIEANIKELLEQPRKQQSWC